MAVPSYTTDLTTIAIGSITVDAGTWDESSDAGWDTGGSMVDDGNLYYNGSACVSAQMTKDSNGSGASGPATILYEHTSTFTVPTDGAILVHHLWAAPPALNTLAGGGIIILVGNSLGDLYGWNASGSDAPPAPRGGWANYAINPAIGSADHTVGTAPSSPWDTVGMGVGATQQARGNPNACNAIRYGRCESIFEHGESGEYATFAGYGAIDSAIANKWNLVDPVPGGFTLQGLVSLGTATNAVDFRDVNATLNVLDTINVTANFNKIEVVNASSNIEWSALSISALGTTSKGKFEAVDNATIYKNACTFTDMDTFIYQSNSTIIDSIYRRCGLVTQGSAEFTGCTFDQPSGPVGILVNALGDITDCAFSSDGTGHAVDLGTVAATTSMTWDNLDIGYTALSSGNETILVNVNSGQTLTINVSATGTTPSVYNTGTGTVNVVAGQKSFSFTISPSITGYEWRIYSVTAAGSLAGSVELDGEEIATADNQSYSYTYTADTPIAVQIIDDDYEESVTYYTLINGDQAGTINLTVEENT